MPINNLTCLFLHNTAKIKTIIRKSVINKIIISGNVANVAAGSTLLAHIGNFRKLIYNPRTICQK